VSGKFMSLDFTLASALARRVRSPG